ncbi:MAG: hypothetical protein ACI808_000461 [Paraglaciecola sp.]|jgi:hypothetical protein
MNDDERIAYTYLKKIYSEREVIFEPNGYAIYPDFRCKKTHTYEVTGLYSVSQSKTDLESETPIVKFIECLIDKYNKVEYGYALDILIDGNVLPKKNKLEQWFKANNSSISELEFTSACLTIKLIKQSKYREKYTIYGIDGLNGDGWAASTHISALAHAIEKKEKVMAEGDTLVLVNHIYPNIMEEVKNHPIDTKISRVVVINCNSELQYSWPNKAI